MFATTILVLFITKIAKNALFRIPSLKFRLELPKISGTVSTSVSLFCSGDEKEKMTKYNDRIVKATFCPLIFTTTGRTGPQVG